MHEDTPGGRDLPECRAEGNLEREKRAPFLATLYCTLPRFPNFLAQQLRRRASLPGRGPERFLVTESVAPGARS